jgi:hypothetical protein
LRLLHTHSIGVGILVFVATSIIVNLQISYRLKLTFCALVSLGAVYPLGWGVLAWLIPFTGADVLRGPVEWTFFVPFGGALIIGLLGAVIMLFVGWLRRSPERSSEL